MRMPKSSWSVVATAPAVLFTAMYGSAVADNRFLVQFRLDDWKSAKFSGSQQAARFYETVVKLGCEAQQQELGSQLDVVFRCPQWRALQVATARAAHGWEKWLSCTGFETQLVRSSRSARH